jgi:hypothetical protein
MGTDGRAWAREFMRVIGELPDGPDDIDEGLMIGWFANAIEAGRSAGLEQRRVPPGTDTSSDPLWAAYRAARAEAELHPGHVADDRIIRAAVDAYEAALAEAGRLLPSGAGTPETPNAEREA